MCTPNRFFFLPCKRMVRTMPICHPSGALARNGAFEWLVECAHPPRRRRGRRGARPCGGGGLHFFPPMYRAPNSAVRDAAGAEPAAGAGGGGVAPEAWPAAPNHPNSRHRGAAAAKPRPTERGARSGASPDISKGVHHIQ
eukprot:gene9723-biopygen4728